MAGAIGYGATAYLDNASGTLTLLGDVTNIDPYGYRVETVETTHLGSTSAHREYEPALVTAGNGSVDLNHDQHSATDQLLRAAMLDRAKRTFKVIWPDGATFSCESIVTEYNPGAIAPGELMKSNFTVTFTGVPTFAAS
jgi:predicted secreted protein